MDQPVISLNCVEKFYGRVRVLSVPRLDLALDARVALSGPNGSGKSTLLRLIAGICLPTKGTVERDASRLGLRIGYVPQAGGLTDELSLEQNLDQRRRLCGLDKDPEAKEQVLARAGLVDSRAKRFSELSGGRQRLAALAAALYTDPSWLLIDEPFAGVDHSRRAEIEQLIDERAPRTRLVIVTSPESNEFPFAASQIIFLKDGNLDASQL
jgi:ABC-2 type transport system ATP-binding protein